jgi:hypothetical protein
MTWEQSWARVPMLSTEHDHHYRQRQLPPRMCVLMGATTVSVSVLSLPFPACGEGPEAG